MRLKRRLFAPKTKYVSKHTEVLPYKKGKRWYEDLPCPTCGQVRPVRKDDWGRARRCKQCTLPPIMPMDKNPRWRGGFTSYKGYRSIKLPPHSPYFPMANFNGYVPEHRFIVAMRLGRCLTSKEIVHHIDGDKGNNEWVNLELVTHNSHSHRYRKGYELGYEKGYAEGLRQNSRGD